MKGLPHVEAIIVTGPYAATKPEATPNRRRIFTCRPTRDSDELPCAKEIISAFARRAYRGVVVLDLLNADLILHKLSGS